MTRTSKIVLGSVLGAIAFFIILLGFMIYVALRTDAESEYFAGKGGTVAIVELREEILTSESIVRQLKKYRKDDAINAIVLRVESPGGGVSASQEIYEEVRKTRDSNKPIVVSMGSVAASGGYYVSLGASKIMANPGTITGSIGVISQFLHLSGLMEKIGVTSTTIKSGKFKDTGSPFRGFSEEERRYFQETIDDVYDQFLQVVIRERKLSDTAARNLADGRVFSGRKAYELKLIDTLGTYEDAIYLAAQLAGIDGTPRVIKERKKERLIDLLLDSMTRQVAEIKRDFVDIPVLQYKLIQPK